MIKTIDLECTSCGCSKPVQNYYLKNGSFRQPCKECIRRSSREWKKKNQEKCRIDRHVFYLANKQHEISQATDYSRRKLYGVSSKQYVEILQNQEFLCAICGASYLQYKKGLHLDHNHKTGKVRGLLCHNCNVHVLRVVEEFECLIPKAKEYLQRSK